MPDLSELDVTQLWPAIESAADQVGLGIFVVQIDASPPRMLHVSKRAAFMVGRTPAEIIGTPPWELLPAPMQHRVRELLAHRDGDAPLSIEIEGIRPDGTTTPVELGAARVQTRTALLSIGYLRDLTTEREAIAALRRSEARFRFLVEAAPDGVVILKEGVIVFVNPKAAGLLGVDHPDAALGKQVGSFLRPEDAQLANDRIANDARGGPYPAPNEYRLRTEPERVVEIKAIRCEWEGGPAVLAFARDVTERIAIQLRLVEADRLAALGTLAAGVAHEINNPLTYAQLALQRIERLIASGLTPETARAISAQVADIQHGITRVAAITTSLRTFACTTDTPPGPVDPVVVVDRALRMVDNDLRHRARLVRRVREAPTVTANASRLEQVVVNLLLNAIQSLRHDLARDRIEVTIEPRGTDVVAISITDTGVGIAEAARDRVFDPFFTTKPVGEGMGLGLSVCKSIIESFGGRITLETELGVGTTVTVLLPAHVPGSGALATPAAVATPLTAPSETPLRLLIVDDEPVVRTILADLLSPPHVVTVAAGGELALDAIRKAADAGATFDVILCDMMMPGMSGRDVHHRVAMDHPGMERRIIFVTGGTFAPGLGEFLASAGNRSLMKPFRLEQVLAVIAAVARDAGQ